MTPKGEISGENGVLLRFQPGCGGLTADFRVFLPVSFMTGLIRQKRMN